MSVRLVTRSRGVPLYRQIRDCLQLEIQQQYQPGDALPAEIQLAQRFSVNRHTLRRAIDELVADGLVQRHHGKGVYVLAPAIDYAIGRTTRFTETLELQGRRTDSRVLRKQQIEASGGVARRLQIDDGTAVVFIETLRRVEDKPFCLISHFLPLAICPDVLDGYQAGSLHRFIERHSGLVFKRQESLISAILPDVDDASLLNMPRHEPVLRVKSINVVAESDQPGEYAITRFRGDVTQLSIQP